MHCHLMNFVRVGIVYMTASLVVRIIIYLKMRFVTKDDFSAKIRVLFETLRNPVIEKTVMTMIINFKFLGQLNLVRM